MRRRADNDYGHTTKQLTETEKLSGRAVSDGLSPHPRRITCEFQHSQQDWSRHPVSGGTEFHASLQVQKQELLPQEILPCVNHGEHCSVENTSDWGQVVQHLLPATKSCHLAGDALVMFISVSFVPLVHFSPL